MATTPLSPLQLDDCCLRRLVVEIDPEADELAARDAGFELSFRLGHSPSEDGLTHMVSFGVSAKRPDGDPGQPFLLLEADIAGRFSIPEGMPEEVARALVPTNCFAMLYGVARTVVAQASGLTPYGPVWLPSINLVAVRDSSAGKRKAVAHREKAEGPQRRRAKRSLRAGPDADGE
jgi:preprotein translocase subunit SecB